MLLQIILFFGYPSVAADNDYVVRLSCACVSSTDFEILKAGDSILLFLESPTLCAVLVTEQMLAEEVSKNMYKEQNWLSWEQFNRIAVYSSFEE